MRLTVQARPHEHGWELWLDEARLAQVRALANAADQVRDILDTQDPSVDHATWDIRITPDIPQMPAVTAAREATAAAAAAQLRAAQMTRDLVVSLRDAGLSIPDTATILGVTQARIYQIIRSATKASAPQAQGRRRSATPRATMTR